MGFHDPIQSIELPIGTQFENALRNAMHGQCLKVQNKNGSAMDKYQGTDFTYMGMRVDATLHFSGKRWMPYVMDTDIAILPGKNLRMGIRHGNTKNGYTEFPEPVVVIDCDCDDKRTYEDMADEVFATLVRNSEEIANYAVDAYADYTETDVEERKNLFSEPLRPNPAYRRPRHLGRRFAELNDLQDSLMAEKVANETQLE